MHVDQDDRIGFAGNPRLPARREAFVKQANISGMDAYRALCAEAERDFDGFLGEAGARACAVAKAVHAGYSTKPMRRSSNGSHDGKLNASYNCLDRHLKTQPDKVAIIFEADDGKVTKITYKELYRRVCMMANGLKSLRYQKRRPRHHLHADVDRGGGRDAGLRAHRRDPLGGVRRLLGQEPARAHHRRRRGRGAHRRRADARRARHPAQSRGR